MTEAIIQHITELIAERDDLLNQVVHLRNNRFQPRITVQATSAEEGVRLCQFLLGEHKLPVTVEIISADVAEDNKRLRAELLAAQERIKRLQNNLLGMVGLDSVYANEED